MEKVTRKRLKNRRPEASKTMWAWDSRRSAMTSRECSREIEGVKYGGVVGEIGEGRLRRGAHRG